MEPTPTQPNSGYTGSTTPPYVGSPTDASHAGDSQFSTTGAHATGTGKYPTDATTPNSQPAAKGVQGTLNNALASGKKWLNDSGISDKAQQLPQSAKDLGNKALNSVNSLTTTQKAVGVGLLAAGIAFLATRGGKKKKHDDEGEYRHKARRSPFDHQPHTKDGDYAYDRKGQRPWGASRYGSPAGQQGQGQGGRSRVSSGSGYSSSPSSYGNDYSGRQSSNRSTSVGNSSSYNSGSSGSNSYGNRQSDSYSQPGSGQRRDQGPASGNRYDANTSGGQNPNNLDELTSAY